LKNSTRNWLAHTRRAPNDLPLGFELPRPISVTFIPAKVFDNPALLWVNPGLSRLAAVAAADRRYQYGLNDQSIFAGPEVRIVSLQRGVNCEPEFWGRILSIALGSVPEPAMSRVHEMAGQAREEEEIRLSRGTFSMCFRPPVYRHDGALPSSPSGWDREFESGLLQRGVGCEPAWSRPPRPITATSACRRSERPSRPGASDRSGGDGAPVAAVRSSQVQTSIPSSGRSRRRCRAHARRGDPRRHGS
jgi:hypothetical protein